MNIAIFGSATTAAGIAADVADAAQHGFGAYWTPQIFGPDALTALALAATMTPDIRLGTAVIPVQPRHPMALAQQALTVSQISGGRLNLGIGLSHKPVVEGMWGMPFDRPVRYMSEYLKILNPLLEGGKVSFGGELLTGRGEINVPAEAPPVYVAALGEQMLQLAGKMADGTITWMTGPKTIETLTVPTIGAAAAAAGRPQPEVIAAAPVCLAESDVEIEALRVRAAQEYQIYGQLPSYRAMLDRESMAGPEDLAIVGSVDELTHGLNRFAEAGATMIVANTFGSREQQDATKRALATLL